VKILYVVNSADSQSIPLELALYMQKRIPNFTIASYYASSSFPTDHKEDDVVNLGAKRPFDRSSMRKLKGLLREVEPDIIHTHHSVSSVVATCMAKLQGFKGNLVKTEHNDHRRISKHHLVANHLVFPFQSRIICNSDTTLNSFMRSEKLLARDRAVRIYNGVDTQRIRTVMNENGVQERGSSSKVYTLGHVGRLVPQKNQLRLLEGFAQARAAASVDLRLEIIGEGPLQKTLQEKAYELNVGDAVTFLGGLKRDDVYGRFSNWDGFIMPSIFEGFCNALVEAIAAGLSIAVADLDTLREVSGEVGVFFVPLDVNEIKGAILDIIQSPNGNADFAERYSIENACKNHVALYESLYRGTGPADIPSSPSPD